MEKIIVFDLGGVLLDWDPRHLYSRIFSDPEEMEYFLSEICSPAWNHQMDAGKPFQQAVAELKREHPEYAEQIEAFDARWVEMVGGEISGTVEILQDLKDGGIPLAALSNWSGDTFPRIRDRFPFLDWFQAIVLSGEAGVAKPDPEIYRVLLRKLDREAGDCLFIDDMDKNLHAAKGLGFDVLHFRSVEDLRRDLQGRGFLDGRRKQ